MKKVLEVCEAYGGGVKRQFDYIMQNFQSSSKFQFEAMVGNSSTNEEINSTYRINPGFNRRSLFSLFKSVLYLRNYIKNEQCDLIHAHSTIAGLVSAIACSTVSKKISIIYTPHAYFSENEAGTFKRKIVVSVERYINQSAVKVIHVSQDEFQYAKLNGLLTRQNGVVINNGVPDLSKQYQPINVGGYFVNVARCIRQKNPVEFIEIAKAYCNKHPSAKFVWIGNGPLLGDCKLKINALKMEKNIQFIGYRANPFSDLYKATAFVSTSLYEGLPFSVIEAMSLRKPVALSKVTGHRDLLRQNGYFLNGNIADSVHVLEKIGKEYEKLSRASYRLYQDSFKLSTMLVLIDKLYEGELN